MILALTNQKPEQSYGRAVPGQQHQHTAAAAHFTSNRATVTVFTTV